MNKKICLLFCGIFLKGSLTGMTPKIKKQLNPHAKEFFPQKKRLNPHAKEFVPSTLLIPYLFKKIKNYDARKRSECKEIIKYLEAFAYLEKLKQK